MKIGVAVEADVERAIHDSICIVVGPSGAVWARTVGPFPEPQDCQWVGVSRRLANELPIGRPRAYTICCTQFPEI